MGKTSTSWLIKQSGREVQFVPIIYSHRMHRIHENISLANFQSKCNIMLCSQMSCIAITPKRQRVHKIIKLNKAQNEAHKKCMKLANERRGKSSRAGEPFIHTASNSYSCNFPAVAAVTATVLQISRMVHRKLTSCTGWKQAPNPQLIIFFENPC